MLAYVGILSLARARYLYAGQTADLLSRVGSNIPTYPHIPTCHAYMAIDHRSGSGPECYMRNRENDRDADAKKLDKAIGRVLAMVERELGDEVTDPEEREVLMTAIDRARLDACKVLVPLLERRAALLGLDAQTKGGAPEQNGTIAELERKLALVAPGKAS